MSIYIARRLRTLVAPMMLVASALAMVDGCSNAEDDKAAVTPNPVKQAQATQSSIASAQAALDPHGLGVTHPGGVAAPDAPMVTGAPAGDNPPMNVAVAPDSGPTGMARMLGQPPMTSGSSAAGSLPSAMGAPHIYHLGADTFFLDRESAIGLTSEQKKKLTSLKESAAASYATTQRKIDQGEQDLWVLSSSEAPDITKIETKIGENARLTGQQRMDFIRSIGKAVGVLSDAQRKAVASQAMPMPSGGMPAAPSAPAMGMGDGAPPPSMGTSGPGKMPGGMDPSGGMPPPGMGMGMGGMADAGAPPGMGHM